MEGRGMVLLSCGFMVVYLSEGWSPFRDRIPNGHIVPNPCKPKETWSGVGHKLVGGNGARNPFGEDFARNGRKWTKNLCEKDSDLDGRTNGLELGDPNCTWSEGMTHPPGCSISHPGICEPWNDPKCLDQDTDWVRVACQPSSFLCDGIKSPDVKNKTLRIPRTPVPAQVTTYMCQIFSLPTDRDYHIIASTPIIDNVNVMHHVVLFGCTEDVQENNSPFPCGMLPNSACTSVVSIWTPGSAGECMHPAAGFRMGATGFKKIAVQLHWNNPDMKNDSFDESGMTMYFTPNLRSNDAGILTTGQEELWIPPGETLVRKEAVYPGDCTQRDLTGNIYITAVLNHMHYLGVHHYLELYREGVKIRDIAADPNYNYDNPQLHTFEAAIEIRPGDELRTRCEYASTKQSHTTMFGPATSDEMCYSFITYYPKENSNRKFCLSENSIAKCRLDGDVIEGCEWKTFPNKTDPVVIDMILKVANSCPFFKECTQECFIAVKSAKKHKCLQGDVWSKLKPRFLTSVQRLEFLMRLQSCDCGVSATGIQPITPIPADESTCDWPSLLLSKADHPVHDFYVSITGNCIATGPCLTECISAVQEARKHGCFQGHEWEYGQRYLRTSRNKKALEFLLEFESCNCNIQISQTTTSTASLSLGIYNTFVTITWVFMGICMTERL